MLDRASTSAAAEATPLDELAEPLTSPDAALSLKKIEPLPAWKAPLMAVLWPTVAVPPF